MSRQAPAHKVSRRSLLAATAAVGATGATAAQAAPAERPNILWLVSEDNNTYIGAYGDRLAHTPTIDGLARAGVLYQRAYSTAPVCAPSRFGLITGAYADACAPANHMRARARLPATWRATPEFMRDAGYYCSNNDKTDYNCDLDPARIWNESNPKAHWRDRAPGQPFFAVFNYFTTHESQIFKPIGGRVKPEDIRVPDYLPDTPEIRQDYASYYNLMERMDGQLAERLAELKADGLSEDTIVFYYSDNGGVLPRSKRYCYEEGGRCALVVYIPPKWRHLAPVTPGSAVEHPVSLIDLPPTILALAGLAQPPQMQGQPLFGGPARKPRTHAFCMRNRMDERYDMVRSVTDGRWRYIRNYMPHLPAGQHQAFEWMAAGYQSFEIAHRSSRLTPVQERFFQPRPFEELYDLRTDPDETRNLVDAPPAASALASLRQALDSQMLAVGDNGFIPEGSPLEDPARRAKPGAYPLKKLMALASLAARRREENLAPLRTALTDDSEAMRYWAALGLVMLGDKAGVAVGDVEKRLAVETSPQVKVALAEALAHTRSPDTAARALIVILEAESSPYVKLQALNALTRLGPAASPVLPLLEKAPYGATEGTDYLKSASKYLQLTLTGTYDPRKPFFDISGMRSLAPK